MKPMKYFFSFLLLLAFSASSWAQTNPVSWTTSVEKVSDNEYKVILTANIDKGWAIYSQDLESNDGPIPTTINFNSNKHVKQVGATEERGDKITAYDNMFAMNISKYKGTVQFVQTIKGASGNEITGTVEFMSCNDKTCLPPVKVPFSAVLK